MPFGDISSASFLSVKASFGAFRCVKILITPVCFSASFVSIAVIAPLAPTVAPTAPPPPARFERYTLSSTELFAFDSSVLRMPQPKLDETADLMSRNAQVNNVTISGYTDRLGSDKYNMALSQRRADSVKSFLTNKGIMVVGHTKVYLNDDADLAEKFKDVIILFDPPKDLYGKLVNFIEVIQIIISSI